MTRRVVLLATIAAALVAAPAAGQDVGLDSLQTLVRADSLDPQRHYDLGLAYLRERRYDDADSAFARAVRIEPRNAPAVLAWSVAQDRNRRYWDSLKRRGGDSAAANESRRRDEAFRRAFMIDPFVDILPLAYAARRRAQMPPIPQYTRALAFVDSVVGYSLGFARGPRAVIDSMPPGLIFTRALLAARANQLARARADVIVLLRLAQARERADSAHAVPLPTNELRYLYAALQQRLGNRAQAISLYREVAEHDIGNYMAQVQLARVHEAGQEWSQAMDARRAAIAANPDDPTLVLDLAGSLTAARFAARAESILVDVEPRLPSDPRRVLLLAQAREAQGKTAEAVADYQRFLALAPNRWTGMRTEATRRLDALRQP